MLGRSPDPPWTGPSATSACADATLVSGAVTVQPELPDGDRTVELGAGQALVVPQGIWHRIHLRQPGTLVHVTPGPNGDHRPL
jgi:mannose-6-phosphate isomerase-like protein (cupin superfamily)